MSGKKMRFDETAQNMSDRNVPFLDTGLDFTTGFRLAGPDASLAAPRERMSRL